MKAVTWQGTRDMQVSEVPDPRIEEATDIIIGVTSTGLYGQVPGGQAEYMRVPFGDFLPVKLPAEHDDDRFLFLSDVLSTAWQGLKYAAVPADGTLVVLGAGPIGDMAARMGVPGTASSRSTVFPSGWTGFVPSGPRSSIWKTSTAPISAQPSALSLVGAEPTR